MNSDSNINFKVNNLTIDFLSLYSDFIKKGYFVMENHGIDKKLIEENYLFWIDFFYSKITYGHSLKKPEGYYNYWEEDAAFKAIGIPKESFYFNKKTKLPDNPRLEKITLELFNQLSILAKYLLNCFLSLLPIYIKNSFSPLLKYEESLRIIHSPAAILEKDPINTKSLIRNRAHEDTDLLTLLPSATVQGLQFLNNNNWETVRYQFGDIIVNAGDTFNLVSNGLIKSVTHRVISLNNEDATAPRFSMAYFLAVH